jgi:hypothetical protein
VPRPIRRTVRPASSIVVWAATSAKVPDRRRL